jgi:hypothetical protein
MGAKDISPEVVERCVTLVRLLVAYEAVDDIEKPLADEARAIVALLPEPVDPDLIEARRMAEALGQGGTREQWFSGKWDTGPAIQWHLAGIKRGRQLAQEQS